jgi:hypothetical protein
MNFSIRAIKYPVFLVLLFQCSGILGQTRFAIFTGPQAITASYHINSIKQRTDPKYGFQLGISAKIEFDTRLFFAPSIYYSLKGYKVSFNQPCYPPDSSAINNNTTVHTLETAPLLQYDFSDKPGHYFLRFGPSLDFQLYGREKFQTVDGTVTTVRRAMPYGFTAYGRYAANAVIHFGYEMTNRFLIYAYYEHGLTNLNNEDAGPNIRYRTAGISFGTYLRKKSK